jgi:hypothetical protein
VPPIEPYSYFVSYVVADLDEDTWPDLLVVHANVTVRSFPSTPSLTHLIETHEPTLSHQQGAHESMLHCVPSTGWVPRGVAPQ